MQSSRPRISQKVLRELVEKLHQDDAIALERFKMHPLLRLYQKWAVLLIGGAWLVMMAVAPILLFLVLFGPTFNFTGQWIIVGAWLLAFSFIIGGLFAIALWMDQFIHNNHPNPATLLAGIAILIGTIGVIFLIWQRTNENIPPAITVGISVVLGILFIAWGVYRFINERQTPIVFRVLFLVGSFSFGVGLVITTVALKQEALAINLDDYRALQGLNSLLIPLGAIAFSIANLSSVATRNIQKNR